MFKNLKILYNFFSQKLKKKLFIIQFVVILSSFLEVSTVFLIGPVIELVSQNNSIIERSFIINTVYNFFNFEIFTSRPY